MQPSPQSIIRIFSSPLKKSCISELLLPNLLSLSPSPPALSNHRSSFYRFPSSGYFMWMEIIQYAALCVWRLCNWHYVFKVHPDDSIYQHFISFCAKWYSTVWVYHFIYQHVHLLIDMWVVSTFSPPWIMLLWTFASTSFCGNMFLTFLVYTEEWNG